MSGVNDLKYENIRKVKDIMLDGNMHTKQALAQQTGISQAAVTNILQELKREGMIVHMSDAASTGGRRSKLYGISPDYIHTGTLILSRREGKYVILCRIIDLKGNAKKENTVISETGKPEVILSCIKTMKEKDSKLGIIALSVPGICREGKIGVCDYPDLQGMDLQGTIEEACGIRTVIENDVNCACYGFAQEYPDLKDIVFLYQPDAEFTGCGIMMGRKLIYGKTGAAGELRFLPYRTEDEQLDMLKKAPERLLGEQAAVICSVLDPEVIGYCSDVTDESIEKYIPEYRGTTLVRKDSILELIEAGLFAEAKKNI